MNGQGYGDQLSTLQTRNLGIAGGGNAFRIQRYIFLNLSKPGKHGWTFSAGCLKNVDSDTASKTLF